MSVRKSCYVFEHRITFLGAARVGKSAIINQFIEKEFLTHYTPTSEHHLTYVIEHRGTMCVCLFVDTAGSDDFPAMRKLSLTKGNVFVVIYAIDDERSFTRAKQFVEEIKSMKGDCADTKIMFVGNKVDLEAERKVTYEDGYSYTMDINFTKNIKATFAEATAKEQDSVQAVLYKLLSMFKIPDLVEVPVLEEKKILSKIRKHNKIKREKKSKAKEEVVRTKSSSSESDVGATIPVVSSSAPTTSMSTFPPIPASAVPANFHRPRAGSIPNIKTTLPGCHKNLVKKVSLDNNMHMKASLERLPSYPFHGGSDGGREGIRASSLSRHGGSNSHISSPKLISHSISLNKYTFHDARNTDYTDSKSSSEDSGVSDDCYNFREGAQSPKLGGNISPLHRKATLSEKMKGMFKRVNSVSNVNKE